MYNLSGQAIKSYVKHLKKTKHVKPQKQRKTYGSFRSKS
jgi:hypothetical protein